MNHLERITTNPEICHGKACIRNMRWPVDVILDMLSSGMSQNEILEDHPELEAGDITACLQYVKLSPSVKKLKGSIKLPKTLIIKKEQPLTNSFSRKYQLT